MASVTYLDTHVVAWLYLGESSLLSGAVQAVMQEDDLRISPMVLLELEFLHETGRLRVSAVEVVQELQARIGLELCDLPFWQVIQSARAQGWTRDPFDRVIVGQAAAARSRLVTRDETIQKNYRKAFW